MKEAIQKLREEKKGFTLAELLVVVAIIAVLVAIAIPVFTSSLDNAKTQADATTIRGGYAAATIAVMDEKVTADTWYGLNKNGTLAAKADGDFVPQGSGTEDIGGQSVTWATTDKIYYQYDVANKLLKVTTTKPGA